MNSIFTIFPYKDNGIWMFDDATIGVKREVFVGECNAIIDALVKRIKNAEKGFTARFSCEPFPGYDVRFIWIEAEYNGDWYYDEKTKLHFWLCSCLKRFFKETPEQIYVQATPQCK